MTLVRRTADAFPESAAARMLLVTLLQQQGETDTALAEASALLGETLSDLEDYTCSACGHVQDDVAWRCPACGAWNSFLEETAS